MVMFYTKYLFLTGYLFLPPLFHPIVFQAWQSKNTKVNKNHWYLAAKEDHLVNKI